MGPGIRSPCGFGPRSLPEAKDAPAVQLPLPVSGGWAPWLGSAWREAAWGAGPALGGEELGRLYTPPRDQDLRKEREQVSGRLRGRETSLDCQLGPPPSPPQLSGSPPLPSVIGAQGPDAMILVFRMLSFKPTFSLSSFTFIK